jgi:cyclophilin family peptidyl-prolyl cis-trans isomerase
MQRTTISTASTHCAAILAAAGLMWASGCGHSGDVPTTSISSRGADTAVQTPTQSVTEEPVNLVATSGQFQSPAQSEAELHPEVAIRTNFGTIRARLDGEKAPRTVANFLYNYVDTGFYDQTVFHYVEKGYMIAGGGYTATLSAKQTEPPIPCEADNQLSNRRGTLAMARHPGFVNSATSQFFINLVDNPGLDYQPQDPDGVNGYCVFGQVIAGMDVVDKIAEVPVHEQRELINAPVEPVIIESITRVK